MNKMTDIKKKRVTDETGLSAERQNSNSDFLSFAAAELKAELNFTC